MKENVRSWYQLCSFRLFVVGEGISQDFLHIVRQRLNTVSIVTTKKVINPFIQNFEFN